MKRLVLILGCLLSGLASALEIVDQLEHGYRRQLRPLLAAQRELLPEKELNLLLAILDDPNPLPIDVRSPVDLRDSRRFEDWQGNPAGLTADGLRFLDNRMVPCEARVVKDRETDTWVMQFATFIWKSHLGDRIGVPVGRLPILFHELIRLGWHRYRDLGFTSTDDGGLISHRLKLPAETVEKNLGKLFTPAGELDHSHFTGELTCGHGVRKSDSVPLAFELWDEPDLNRTCTLDIRFSKKDLHYRVTDPMDTRVLLELKALPYQIRGSEIHIQFPESLPGETVLTLESHRDILNFGYGGRLYRVEATEPATSVAGRFYEGEMFCYVNGAFGNYFDTVIPFFPRVGFACVDSYRFGTDGTYEYRVNGEKGEAVYRGRYEQIGHNVLLTPGGQTVPRHHGNLWVSRSQGGKELVTPSGELLFENAIPREAFLPSLGRTYQGQTYCEAPENVKEKDDEKCEMQIDFNRPSVGWMTIKLTRADETIAYESRGTYDRAGTLLAIRTDSRYWVFRHLEGQLVDGFRNELKEKRP